MLLCQLLTRLYVWGWDLNAVCSGFLFCGWNQGINNVDMDICIFCLTFACDGILGKNLMVWWGQGVNCQELDSLVKQTLNGV